MRTLSRYFAVRYLSFFAAILIVSTLTITLVETFVNFEEAIDPKKGFTALLRYLLIRIPSYYLHELIPISAFSAAFFSLALSTQRFEWVATQAAGLSIRQIILPLAVASFGLAVLTSVLGETLLRDVAGGHASRLHRSMDQLTFRGGVFWHHSGNTIYKMAHANASERTLGAVEIFHRTRNGRLKAVVFAPHVRIAEDGTWHVEGAHIREFDPEHPERPARIRLNVDFELPPLSEDSSWLEETRPTTLSVPELIDYIAQHPGDGSVGSQAVRQRLTSFLHQRLTEPILVIVLTLLAIPFALRVTPGGSMAGPAVLGLGFLASFFFLRSLSQGLVGQGLLPPVITVWAVPMTFALGSLIALARTSRPR